MQTLNIDQQFSSLIAPLSEMEYHFLEASIRKDGCMEPIVVWRGTIIDGHNRYHICSQWSIPFTTVEKHFSDRLEAIAWICSKQLGRRNISEEIRKYLIGRQFDAEKILRKRRRADHRDADGICSSTDNAHYKQVSPQATPSAEDNIQAFQKGTRKNPTADLIGDEHHISHSTVEKYSLYSRALDTIGQSSPSLQERILSGKCKLSYANVISLSHMEPSAVEELAERLSMQEASAPFIPYHSTREVVEHIKADNKPIDIYPEIKRMPKPDPDADVNRLTLTITAWISSIKKTQAQITINMVSADARKKLENALNGLSLCIHSFLELIGGGKPDAE